MPLERPRLRGRSWHRKLARVGFVGLGVALLARSADVAGIVRGPDCATAIGEKAWASAVTACQVEFDRAHDPAIGAHLANAQDKAGDPVTARQTAGLLLLTSARPEALYVLGRIAHADRRTDEAVARLEEAREAHRAQHRAKELAQDDGLLAMVRTARSELGEALRLADESITQAELSGDPDARLYSHLVAAKALIRVGYWSAADEQLEIATALSTTELQRSDLAYQRGSNAQEVGEHATAIGFYKKSLEYLGHPDRVAWTIRTELNLAYSLAEHDELDKAQRYLQAATLLDVEGKKAPERAWTGACVAYRLHDLARATSLLDTHVQLTSADDASGRDNPFDRDDRIDVFTLQARIALERGDLESAERSARRGVEQAELVRGAQSTLELRPWVLVKRRAPYELLFTALARRDQFEDAALVFDEWQGRTLQDALATPRPQAALARRDMADRLTRLGSWLRVASQAAFAKPADRASVLNTMRGIDLLALIVADGEVWRLTASHGAPQLARLTSLAAIRERLGKFRTDPTDRTLAAELGALLVPDEAFQTHDLLHVLVDARLGSLPVAALRHGSAPLISIRPIVHALRLPELRCVHAPRPGRATVLGFASATIPNATAEANEVAALLHTTSSTGAAATKAALFAAANDAVLHVAAHGEVGPDGAALALADGDFSALEIMARRVGPALAVLSACDVATSNDGERAGSLVAGFLGGGSQHVVATLRSITDAGAREISTRFYRAGGVADPPRALANVQAELARTDNREWPNFAVFGPDVCRDGASDHQ